MFRYHCTLVGNRTPTLRTNKLCTVQIHFPFPFFKQTTLADGLQEAVDLGLTAAVGVCNYNTAQLEEMHSLLDKKSIPLATNQVIYDICCQRVNHG